MTQFLKVKLGKNPDMKGKGLNGAQINRYTDGRYYLW
jgi:hypothetical protein